MARGGRRSGTAGKAYQQRTDLHVVSPSAASGQPYGAAKAQTDSQRAVPVANGDLSTAGAGASPTPPAVPQQGGQPPVTGLPAGLLDQAAAHGLPEPGSLPPLSAPTDRPGEHMMTGVNAGPGQGVEALSPTIVHPLVAAAGVLNSLGNSASPQVKTIRDVINAQLSNQAVP